MKKFVSVISIAFLLITGLVFAGPIFDMGEFTATADLELSFASDNSDEILVKISGDQAEVFFNEDEKKWTCTIEKDEWYYNIFSDKKTYVCTFSFIPAINIPDDIRNKLENHIKFENISFNNVWQITDRGYSNITWGYSEIYDLLRILTPDNQTDDKGFWMHSADDDFVFRCQSDTMFQIFPCWRN